MMHQFFDMNQEKGRTLQRLSSGLLLTSCVTLSSCDQGPVETDGKALYQRYCASCHGANHEGGNSGSLIDDTWKYGSDRKSIFKSIHDGIIEAGMPAFGNNLTDEQIENLIDYLEVATPEDTLEEENNKRLSEVETLDYRVAVDIYADGLDSPWAIDFTYPGEAIITEKNGSLRIVRNGQLDPRRIKGLPKVLDEGQGGLLDVTVDPNYIRNPWIYLSYSHPLETSGSPAMTKVVRGKIINNQWSEEQTLFEADHASYLTTRQHYGSRIVFDAEGYLYFCIGDRGQRFHAQDLTLPNGKVHRLFPDGSIPDSNPFLSNSSALPSIFSYGHRNPQGMAFHPETGELWVAEHGPRGGDELNISRAGKNYGWPEITYGIEYSGRVITLEREQEGLEQPILFWRPSTAVCGIDFYTGDLFPLWKNQLLVTALRDQDLRLLRVYDGRVLHEEILLDNIARMRDVRTGPDGAIYVVLNQPGQVLRLTPVSQSLQ